MKKSTASTVQSGSGVAAEACDNGNRSEAAVAVGGASFLRRNGWIKWAVGGLAVALAAAAGTVELLLHRAEPYLRARVVEGLADHFHARVELDSFHVSLVNGLWAEGKGLRIWPPEQAAGGPAEGGAPGEPLIRLDEFRFHAPLRYRPGRPIHIAVVELKGLDVELPPRSHFGHPAVEASTRKGAGLVSFDVDRLDCTGARLVLATDKPGKLPLEFAIAHLGLTNVGSGGAIGFDAELTNPRPVGAVHTVGRFGPWPPNDSGETVPGQTPAFGDPGESPITGDYRFDHADLASFKGIAGIVNSTGHYQGTLRDLVVDGAAGVAEFRLTHFNNPLPLQTHFHAKVDGTNGDTWLEPVEGTLGHSHFSARGQIVRVPANAEPGAPSLGHDIALTIDVDWGRIEDFLHLASHSATPLLTGDVTVKGALHIPPGPLPVQERMTLAGAFTLDGARFSSDKIQGRIEQLSLRGQGRPRDLKSADPASVRSRMEGKFQLAGGVIALPALTYSVPGAEIQLSGAYGLEGGALNFAGTAKMEATVSQMVGGWKGLLLKPADRFFKKNGAGTEVPIHIEGTREEPKFGIDFDRMKAGPKQSK